FAALLAFLLPGMGHFYQRRIFKGVLYCVCILGTFFTGLRIGHGQVVYWHWKQSDNRTWAYMCQVWTGLPALPALAQSQLRSHDSLAPNFVAQAFSSSFEATLSESGNSDAATIGELTGTIDLPQLPVKSQDWTARVKGTLVTPQGSRPIEGELRDGKLDPEVAPWPRRRITDGHFAGRFGDQQGEPLHCRIEGSIPRSLWNSYEAPLQDPGANDFGSEVSDLNRAHKELGGRFELGVVYTMIAGLLNILAIYDAFEGPAYEEEEDETQIDKPPPNPEPPPAK
ncbi:MAG TPA: DUF6677 family protein, partial [Planctomycetaceae bacterium]|nr:DUF6677 family protein [Planctomycetaceae bacterium]